MRRKRFCQRSEKAPDPAGTHSPASALVALGQAGTEPTAAGDGGCAEDGLPQKQEKARKPLLKGILS